MRRRRPRRPSCAESACVSRGPPPVRAGLRRRAFRRPRWPAESSLGPSWSGQSRPAEQRLQPAPHPFFAAGRQPDHSGPRASARIRLVTPHARLPPRPPVRRLHHARRGAGRRRGRAVAGSPTSSGSTSSRFQDHPYQPRFLDTWTLLSVVAAQTTNVRRRAERRQPAAAAAGRARPQRREPRHPQRRPGRARARRRRVLGRASPPMGGAAADARAERRRARRGDRRHPRDLGRRRRPDPRTTASTTGSTARSPGRRRRTTSRSGSAPTSRGCCASPARRPTAGCRAWATSSSSGCRSMNARDRRRGRERRAPARGDPAAAQRQRQLRRRQRVPRQGSPSEWAEQLARADADDRDEHVHPLGRPPPTTCGASPRRSRRRCASWSPTRAERPSRTRRTPRPPAAP